MAAPPPPFLETNTGTQTIIGLSIAGMNLLVIGYVGWNRLSAIPLFYTFFTCLGSFLGWWNWSPNTRGAYNVNAASLFFNFVGYEAGEPILVMYSYFILDRLLPSVGGAYPYLMKRRTFRIVFWTLQAAHVGVRSGIIVHVMVEFIKHGNANATETLYALIQAQFVLLALIEVFTAYLLIRIFSISRATAFMFLGGRKVGLFTQMILSTEVRVASLAALGVARLALEQPKRHSDVAWGVDQIAVMLLVVFPMLLVLDLVFTRAVNLETDLQARIERCRCMEPVDLENSRRQMAQRMIGAKTDMSASVASSS